MHASALRASSVCFLLYLVYTTHFRTVPVWPGLVFMAKINIIAVSYEGTAKMLILAIKTETGQTGTVLKCIV